MLAGVSAYFLRFTDWAIRLKPVQFDLTFVEFMSNVGWVALAWILIFAFAGLYSPNPNKKFSKHLGQVIYACSTGLAVVAVYVMFTQQLFDSRFLVAAGWGFAVVYVIAGRLLMRGLKSLMYRAGIGLRRIIVIGSEELAQTIITTLQKRPELGYNVVGTFTSFSAQTKKKIAKQNVDELLFTNSRAHEKQTLEALDFCNEYHITFKYSADLFATYAANMNVHPLAGIPIVEIQKTRLSAWGRVVKRLFDIIMSVVMIVVLSPFMLITAIAIRLESGGPVVYKNKRVGIRGSEFTAFKFRSMYQKYCTGDQFGYNGKKAEELEKKLIKKQSSRKGPIYKVENDPRVTKVGRFIRRWSIDEFPQFFNVLVGDMSIVGPRPHQPREVAGYATQHKTVFSIKPGITGLAQISGRSDLHYEDEMKLDILYIERWKLGLDFIIFFKTPFVLFKKRKAE